MYRNERKALPEVAVIIAAYRAAGTIGKAITSALAEPEVAQVIVVDDCSPDATADAAHQADDGSGRLQVVTQAANAGPAAARNRALNMANAPFVAILDSDDYFLPGRFARLFDLPEWDIAADNVMFLKEGATCSGALERASAGSDFLLPFDEFVDRNISRFGRPRGELGFLKPVIRRSFLERHGLRYDETLRLGEDFALYVRALLAGAQFRVTSGCGYVAIERADSLSGLHKTADLEALVRSDDKLLAEAGCAGSAHRLLARHRAHLAARHAYRAFLDQRRQSGVASALIAQARRPVVLASILRSYVLDKISGMLRRSRQGGTQIDRPAAVRFLIEA